MNWNIKLMLLSACVSCSLGLPVSEADSDSEAYSRYYSGHNQRQPRYYGYGNQGNHGRHGSHSGQGSHSRHIRRYGYKPIKSVDPVQVNKVPSLRHSKPVRNLPIANLRHVKPSTNHPAVSPIQKPKIRRVQSVKPKPVIQKVSRPNNFETFDNTVREILPINRVRDIQPGNSVKDVIFVPDIDPLNILTDPHLDNLVLGPIPSPSPIPLSPIVPSPIPSSPIIPPPEPISPSSPVSFPSRISLDEFNIPQPPFSLLDTKSTQQISPEPSQSLDLDLPPAPSQSLDLDLPPAPSFDKNTDEFVSRTPFLPEPVPAVPGQNSVSFLKPIPAVPRNSDDIDTQISFLNPNDFMDENDGQVSFLQPVPAVPGLPVTQF